MFTRQFKNPYCRKKDDFSISITMMRRIFDTKFALVLIALVIFLNYANSLTNSFVYDDPAVITDSSFIKSWKNFPALFSKSYLSPFVKRGVYFSTDSSIGSGEASYRPVVTLSYFLDYSFWKLNPFGYHLTNIILHILNALLLFIFVDMISKDKRIALLASLFFALHPVNSEAVNVVSFREDLLAFLFFLSSFILYIKSDIYRLRKINYTYIFSLVLFLFSLFSKEMSVTLPFLLILYDRYFACRDKNKKFFMRLIPGYAGYLAILFFYLWVRFFLMVNLTEPQVGYPGGSFYSNLLTMSRVLATYIKWLLFPINIPVVMPNEFYLVSKSLLEPEVLFSLTVIATCVFTAIKIYKSSREVSLGISWFFITLLPVSNLIPISNYIASRYLYLPALGFCLLAAACLRKLSAFKPAGKSWITPAFAQETSRVIIIILLTCYSIFTFVRNISWRNDIGLLLGVLERFPENALVHASLGDCFKNNGEPEKAIIEYKEAIRLSPGMIWGYNNLGLLFIDKGRYEEAVYYFTRAIKIDPGYLRAYNNLGVAYAKTKQFGKAREIWEKALSLSSQDNALRKDIISNLEKLKASGH